MTKEQKYYHATQRLYTRAMVAAAFGDFDRFRLLQRAYRRVCHMWREEAQRILEEGCK